MQKKRTFTVMAILIAVLVLGVGYAVISNVNLNLTGSANIIANSDFTVVYDNANHTPAISPTGTVTDGTNTHDIVDASYSSSSLALMTVWLDGTHDTAYAIYKIDNNSSGLSATLTANVTNVGSTQAAYFDDIDATYYKDELCTQALGTDKLDAGDSAYLKVTVTLVKTPVNDVTNGSFAVQTVAAPAEAD